MNEESNKNPKLKTWTKLKKIHNNKEDLNTVELDEMNSTGKKNDNSSKKISAEKNVPPAPVSDLKNPLMTNASNYFNNRPINPVFTIEESLYKIFHENSINIDYSIKNIENLLNEYLNPDNKNKSILSIGDGFNGGILHTIFSAASVASEENKNKLLQLANKFLDASINKTGSADTFQYKSIINPSTIDKDGNNLLHLALKYRFTESAQKITMLAENYDIISAKNRENKSPADYAKSETDQKLVKLLKNKKRIFDKITSLQLKIERRKVIPGATTNKIQAKINLLQCLLDELNNSNIKDINYKTAYEKSIVSAYNLTITNTDIKTPKEFETKALEGDTVKTLSGLDFDIYQLNLEELLKNSSKTQKTETQTTTNIANGTEPVSRKNSYLTPNSNNFSGNPNILYHKPAEIHSTVDTSKLKQEVTEICNALQWINTEGTQYDNIVTLIAENIVPVYIHGLPESDQTAKGNIDQLLQRFGEILPNLLEDKTVIDTYNQLMKELNLSNKYISPNQM